MGFIIPSVCSGLALGSPPSQTYCTSTGFFRCKWASSTCPSCLPPCQVLPNFYRGAIESIRTGNMKCPRIEVGQNYCKIKIFLYQMERHTLNNKGTILLFLSQCLRIGSFDFYSHYFKFGGKHPRCTVTDCSGQNNYMIRCHDITPLDTLHPTAAPWDSRHENHKEIKWQATKRSPTPTVSWLLAGILDWSVFHSLCCLEQ